MNNEVQKHIRERFKFVSLVRNRLCASRKGLIHILCTKSPNRFRYADSLDGFATSTGLLFAGMLVSDADFSARERRLFSPLAAGDTALL